MTVRLVPSCGVLAALLVALPAALRPLASFDVFFNIAQGRWILEHGFPSSDPFSFTASSAWSCHEWGFGGLLALLEPLLGGWAPTLLSATLLAVAVLLFWHLLAGMDRVGSPLLPLLFFLALAVGSWMWSAQRAYLVGPVMLSLVLWLVRQAPGGKPHRRWWLLVPLVWLWANLHGSWPLGPAVAGLALAGSWLDDRSGWRELPAALPALGLALLVPSLSPDGLRTVLYPLSFLAGDSGAGIWEWGTLDPSSASSWCLLLLVLLQVLLAWRHGWRWHLGLPALALLGLAASAGRHAPLAALVLAASCVELWQQPPRRSWRVPALLAKAARLLRIAWQRWRPARGIVWSGLALLLVTGWCLVHPVELAGRMDRGWFPVISLRTLCRQPPGRVLNRYFLGGAVSALCGPAYPVFIDGRNDLFPRQVHDDYRRLVLLEPGWQRVLEHSGARYVLWSPLNHGRPLLEHLEHSSRWQLLASEPSGALFVRRGEPRPAGQ